MINKEPISETVRSYLHNIAARGGAAGKGVSKKRGCKPRSVRKSIKDKEWRRANRGRPRNSQAALMAAARAKKIGMECTCCTAEEIAEIYSICASKGGGHEVDHVLAVALGGMHCVHNLQILTKADHHTKSNIDRQKIRNACKKAGICFYCGNKKRSLHSNLHRKLKA